MTSDGPAASREVSAQPASQAGRRGRLAVALLSLLLVVLAALVVHHDLLVRSLDEQVDLRVYLWAGDRAVAGLEPYAVPGYFYTPTFAVLVGRLHASLGTERTLVAYRCAALAGVWLLLLASLAGSRAPPWLRLAAAPGIAASPLVYDGLFHGNASLALAGPLVCGLVLCAERPLLGGLVAGGVNAMKPFALSALAVAVIPLRRGDDKRRLTRTAIGAVAATACWLLVGARWLPSMLARAGEPVERMSNIALAAALRALGVPAGPLLVLAAVTAVGAWWSWRRADTPRQRVAIATATAVVALPVNNPSTFLLTLPVQVLALEVAAARLGAARAAGRGRTRAFAELAMIAAAVLSVHGSRGVRIRAELPYLGQGLLVLIPLSAVVLLVGYAFIAQPPIWRPSPDGPPVEAPLGP